MFLRAEGFLSTEEWNNVENSCGIDAFWHFIKDTLVKCLIRRKEIKQEIIRKSVHANFPRTSRLSREYILRGFHLWGVKNVVFVCDWDIRVIDQAWVKITILSKLFLGLYGASRKRGPYTRNNSARPICLILTHAWSITDLLYEFTVNDGARTTGKPERER